MRVPAATASSTTHMATSITSLVIVLRGGLGAITRNVPFLLTFVATRWLARSSVIVAGTTIAAMISGSAAIVEVRASSWGPVHETS